MFLLFGETVRGHSEPDGEHQCAVCGRNQSFSHIVERRYFTVFGIPLLQIDTMADYLACNACSNSYVPGVLSEPSQVAVIRQVVAYIAVGYGTGDHPQMFEDVFTKVTGLDLDRQAFLADIRAFERGDLDIFRQVRNLSANVNVHGKQQVIEAAFLVTYASCEMEYEDRLRINLVGNALGVSLEYIESVVNYVRSQGYYGVRRLLSTAHGS